MPAEKQTLYLVDGSSYIHRAFHAIKDLSTSKGLPTNAAYGFLGMLRRVLREKRPRYMAIALDAPGPTFRHELTPAYKATRAQMAEALSVQIPFIKRLIAAYGIRYLELPGYEADDIIGTLAGRAAAGGAEVVVVSGDKDLLQLVGPRVHLWDTAKDRVVGPAEVEQRFGVPPAQVVEVMGLAGDSVDNIPGVPGIGIKTAQRLIKEFATIENLLGSLDKVAREKERQKLEQYADQARLSRQLAVVNCEAPLEVDWHQLQIGPQDREALLELFRELEFRKFIQELEKNVERAPAEPEQHRYPVVATAGKLEEVVSQARQCGRLALATLNSDTGSLRGHLVGLALAWGKEAAYYVPLAPLLPKPSAQLQAEKVIEALAPMLSDSAVAKVGHDLKSLWLALSRHGIDLSGMYFDTMVGSYLLDPARSSYKLDSIAREHLDRPLLRREELWPAGKKDQAFSRLPIERAATYAAGRAEVCLQLAEVMAAKLEDAEQTALFHEIEMPLVRVLARMEANGVRVDVALLRQFGQDLDWRLEQSAARIYDLAGERFNINSTQQLGRVLYDKLGLPVGKKTKSGYSTAMGVLAALAPLHPLPAEVITYRSISKLKTAYVDALPRMLDPETGRIHSSYNQTVTRTGRLSSSGPNLQNIPIRTQEGRQIRRAFVAEPGCQLLAADYSQIELRILAHYSKDGSLVAAFRRGEDIHRRTAAEIFGVEPEAVTAAMRRQAKMINFGIIYGMSPFRLGKELGIGLAMAREIINRYFERYSGVRSYVESMPELGRKQGFVTTLFNRKRFLPDLHSRNRNVRQFAERTAINTPIQGTAADIIKLAMVRIDAKLQQRELPARLIMQVHDELVFEVEAEFTRELAGLVKREMESVAALQVPLVVDVGWGGNWDEAH